MKLKLSIWLIVNDVSFLKKFMIKTKEDLKYDLSECDLLKINIMNDEMIKFHNVSNFYVDDNMESKNAIYTYNNIRPSCIKKINLNTIIYEGLTILENNDDFFLFIHSRPDNK